MAAERKPVDDPVSETAPTVVNTPNAASLDVESGLRAVANVDARDEAWLTGGAMIGDRYVIDRPLAEGGMGAIYLGRHVELGQAVAIKLLRSDLSDRPSVVQRFLNEARAAASLKSEHVVRVMDVGQLSSGRPYLVMEHLEGMDLDALLEREGPLPIDRAVEYVLQVCEALSVAHREHIVHRDIKPENLFLVKGSNGDVVKVVDFGLAKRIDSAVALTGPEDSMGSPFYMSPEQIVTPQKVDLRTDVWSLGVVLYRLVTGSVPFPGDSITEVYARVLNAEPVPASQLHPEIDVGLDRILARCMAKDAARRFQNTEELALCLERYSERRKRPVLALAPLSRNANDEPVEIPGVGTPWSMLLIALLVAFGIGFLVVLKHVDKSEIESLRDRATAVLESDSIRDLDENLRTGPRLNELAGPPAALPAHSFTGYAPGGVVASDPAFDSGGRTLRARSEFARSEPIDPEEAAATDGIDKNERYREYLREHGFVPLRDALQGANATSAASDLK